MDGELLRAICERPDDTALRLVAADWLEERGALDRANFIRAQCADAGVPSYAAPSPRGHDPGWLPALPRCASWSTAPFRRGFPSAIVVRDLAALVADADAVFAAAPVCELEVAADPRTFSLATLLAAPWLSRITRLHISGGGFGADDIARLADCAALTGLRALELAREALTSDGLRALLAAPLLRQLHALGLRGAFTPGDAGWRRQLDHVPALPALVALDLAHNPLGHDGWRAIAAAPWPLEHLDLSTTSPEDRSVAALAGSRHARRLRSLAISLCQLGPRAARALVARTWPALEYLDASYNKLGDRGFALLADATTLPNLRRADLRQRAGSLATAARAHAWLDSTEAMRAMPL